MAQPAPPHTERGRYSPMLSISTPAPTTGPAPLVDRRSATPTARPTPQPVLSILLPVYNEEATLEELLDRLLAIDPGVPFEVVAVNDASADRSQEILEERDDPRLTVINHRSNRGKGAAVRTAVSAAKGRVTVIQDADLEYDPEQLRDLVTPVLSGEADVVYGSRFLGSVEHMRRRNRLANLGLSWMTRLLYNTHITDMETCYKVIPRDVFLDLEVEAQRFDMEPEITARLIRRGHQITELPIEYEGRTHDDGKKIGYADGFEAIATLIKWRFSSRP